MTTCTQLGCPAVPEKIVRCHCSGCHQTFSGVSSFDKHQTFPDGGTLTCNDPASRGLVLRDGVWGWPDRGDGTWRGGRDHARGIREAKDAIRAGDAATAAYLLDAPVEAVERVAGTR